jgi:hypothetical protein
MIGAARVTNSRVPRQVLCWMEDIMDGFRSEWTSATELDLKAAAFRAFVFCHFKLLRNATFCIL